ncbi:MAG: RagB/SusD family nutrient uptake outer membrane protein, partial [Muribaculaceae bacterium]|nr:RagB/SusD family nutrient uptake outer membrane protein [Muribaculaceae bacterium]
MNRNIKAILAIGLAAASTACSDLDVDMDSHNTQYPNNPIALEAKLADTYYSFRGALGRRGWEFYTLASDETMSACFGDSWFNNAESYNTAIHNFTADDVNLSWYSDIESGISNCNRVIVEIGGETGEDPVVAPVRAMRAFYHFLIMDIWGDCPILDHQLDEGEAAVRAPRGDVARFIEKECLALLEQNALPVTTGQENYGKPTKWMVEALLAKLYINWAVYTADKPENYSQAMTNEKLNDVVKYCDDIISSGLFEVGKGYRQKFFPTNGAHVKDFIYAMEYDHFVKTGMQYARHETHHYANKMGTPYCGGFKLGKSAAGNRVVNPRMVDILEALPGDERADVLVGKKAVVNGKEVREVYVYDPVNYNMTGERAMGWGDIAGQPLTFTKEVNYVAAVHPDDIGTKESQWLAGYKSIKFPGTESSWSDYNQDNDVPLFRYADVLLMKAEAILRGATATMNHTAVSLVNEVR